MGQFFSCRKESRWGLRYGQTHMNCKVKFWAWVQVSGANHHSGKPYNHQESENPGSREAGKLIWKSKSGKPGNQETGNSGKVAPFFGQKLLKFSKSKIQEFLGCFLAISRKFPGFPGLNFSTKFEKFWDSSIRFQHKPRNFGYFPNISLSFWSRTPAQTTFPIVTRALWAKWFDHRCQASSFWPRLILHRRPALVLGFPYGYGCQTVTTAYGYRWLWAHFRGAPIQGLFNRCLYAQVLFQLSIQGWMDPCIYIVCIHVWWHIQLLHVALNRMTFGTVLEATLWLFHIFQSFPKARGYQGKEFNYMIVVPFSFGAWHSRGHQGKEFNYMIVVPFSFGAWHSRGYQGKEFNYIMNPRFTTTVWT